VSLLFLAVCSVCAASPGVEQADLFVAGQDGYHTFRIPAIVASSKGTLLAFCEGRKTARGDSGDIDTVLRRSSDGGQTWQPLAVVADDGPHTLGNPCPVVDRTTGTIWLLLTRNHGQDRQDAIEAGTSGEPRTVWVCHSSDDGVTWTKPADTSPTARRGDWGWYGTGPAAGIQLASGRLIVPCHHTPARSHVQHAHVIYSDDNGQSWRLGGVAGPNCGESALVERADGSLLMNIRSHPQAKGKRVITTSSDGGLSWSAPTLDDGLPDPGCQASILRFTASPQRNRLLFANPASGRREKLTVRLSYDEGKTWPVGKVLHDGPAAYSGLVALPDGRIGCLYEHGSRSAYEAIALARFSLGFLTSGADELPR
jgi:sialidase-1